MKSVNKILVLCFIVIQLAQTQQAQNYFPSDTGFKWYYKITPLDSSGKTIDSLSINKIDLFTAVEIYKGKFSNIVVSEIDTNFFYLESTNGWRYIRSFGNLDSLPLFDTLGIIRFLNSFEGWHSYYKFASSTATAYTIAFRDTTIVINGTSYPLRFKISGKRFPDQTVSVPAGNFNCKKFLINYSLNFLTYIPPLPPIEIPLVQIPDTVWITNSIWIVKEHTPPVKIDLSLLNSGSFTIPGRITELTDYTTTSVNSITENATDFFLEQNYPNPFNSTTTIHWRLAVSSYITLKVFDILGNEVATLFNGNAEGGKMYIVSFDSKSVSGGLSSGMYFYKLQSGSPSNWQIKIRKFILVK
ncbi:MAG: T9SS type A sorting domain-containing protein [Bacteroidota bacterium]|nr:T9SS type A sorting domain-containing protein [Bacteroidota bacterium]